MLTSHSSPRNEIKILFTRRIEKSHFFVRHVVGRNLERNDFQTLQAPSDGQNSRAVTRVVEISIRRRTFVGMGHSSWIPTYNEEVGPSVHPCLRVPLHLRTENPY